MRFLIVNVGSRGEYSNYIGNEKNVFELIFDYYEMKNSNSDNEFLDLGIGGLSDLDCFVEIIFDEEDSYFVYEMDGNEVKSSEWTIVDYVDDWDYRLEMD